MASLTEDRNEIVRRLGHEAVKTRRRPDAAGEGLGVGERAGRLGSEDAAACETGRWRIARTRFHGPQVYQPGSARGEIVDSLGGRGDSLTRPIARATVSRWNCPSPNSTLAA